MQFYVKNLVLSKAVINSECYIIPICVAFDKWTLTHKEIILIIGKSFKTILKKQNLTTVHELGTLIAIHFTITNNETFMF